MKYLGQYITHFLFTNTKAVCTVPSVNNYEVFKNINDNNYSLLLLLLSFVKRTIFYFSIIILDIYFHIKFMNLKLYIFKWQPNNCTNLNIELS